MDNYFKWIEHFLYHELKISWKNFDNMQTWIQKYVPYFINISALNLLYSNRKCQMEKRITYVPTTRVFISWIIPWSIYKYISSLQSRTCINSFTAHCLYKGDSFEDSTQAASALIRFRGVSSLPWSSDCGEEGRSESSQSAKYFLVWQLVLTSSMYLNVANFDMTCFTLPEVGTFWVLQLTLLTHLLRVRRVTRDWVTVNMDEGCEEEGLFVFFLTSPRFPPIAANINSYKTRILMNPDIKSESNLWS